MNNELKEIKKLYGEEMMHLCRELFPGILEEEGKLLSILKENLAPTRSFASDIRKNNYYIKFKDWIYSFIVKDDDKLAKTRKTPFELMDEAGYILYECKSEEDIQKFRKYYAEGEELCTFWGQRLKRCHVFFAVKKNVQSIKRKDFANPEREDEYGTSVISIQFSKGKNNDLSIKNRYNHKVSNPDATFGNNLENIIPGLTYSFERYYGLNINQNTKKDGYFLVKMHYKKGNDGRFYHYNFEYSAIYYCENNIIIKDSKVIHEYADNKERYQLMDQYIIDQKEKKIMLLENYENDSFIDSIMSVGEINNIDVIKNGENKTIVINYSFNKNVKIEINQENNIVAYENNYVESVGDYFLSSNTSIKSISLPNVKSVGNWFLGGNNSLENINIPLAERIGFHFLYNNNKLKSIDLPNVIEIGFSFLEKNTCLNQISMPKVESIDANFLIDNNSLVSIDLPSANYIGALFLENNNSLQNINLPNALTIGWKFMKHNNSLTNICFPKVEDIGSDFLADNNVLQEVNLPSALKLGDNMLFNAIELKEFNIPKVIEIGSNLLFNNNGTVNVNALSLNKISKKQSSVIKKELERLKNEKSTNQKNR